MIEIKQNKWFQLPTNFYRQIQTIYKTPATQTLHPQMPTFQLKLFIQQAFEKKQLITVWLTDQQHNEYSVTGKIKHQFLQKNSFLIKTQQQGLTYLANLSQIKYLSLADPKSMINTYDTDEAELANKERL
ncbi:hypothetical protein FC89_GL000065 [Liquorilactobacillus ghanensis DSM 18630]|jgi:hypothetical protein|uniref:YolD-like protein n=1 Tax=Liquorilactobacillus ghanensis DSM 18630 TaxID=1423750 RepID=A0A0R1VPD8_9LACO|nr:hypothetical protein [Liquorilactobacillus ghanensis]KRM07626.1 hypothetical protein FC89_GL000065 [Liquorilactobacillus ghanensis DSM 18630]